MDLVQKFERMSKDDLQTKFHLLSAFKKLTLEFQAEGITENERIEKLRQFFKTEIKTDTQKEIVKTFLSKPEKALKYSGYSKFYQEISINCRASFLSVFDAFL